MSKILTMAAVMVATCVAWAAGGSFSVSVDVDLTAVKPGQVLFDLPGRLRVSVRMAGKDAALRDYDSRFGNYLNFPLRHGACPVLEATLPNEPRTVEYKDLSRKLPRGYRVGFPLALLEASPSKHVVRVEYARTGFRIFADGQLMDEDLLVAEPKWIAEAGLPPAPAAAAVPDAKPIAEPVQYWTAGGFNTWVGDVVVKTWRGRLHVFFLRDRRHHHSKSGTGGHAFAHISSADLRTWVEHPDATTIDRFWLTYGTGTAFELNGRLCLSYGFHSTRYVPVEKTTEPQMLKDLAATGVMPHVRFEGTDLIPLGTSWSESEDGIHFKPSGIVSHTTQNPGIQALPDGRLQLTTGYGGDTGAKGRWVSDGMTGWKLEASVKSVLSGDCPCPFSWDGWNYLLQGFWGFARGKAGEGLKPDRGQDVYDGLAVPMVAPWRDAAGAESRRLLVGWIHSPGGMWAGWMVFRELVQRPDGSLGTKWVNEIRLPTQPVVKRCRGDFRLDFGTADGEHAYRFAVDAKKGEASVVKVLADGKERPVSVLAATSHNTVTGIRGLDGCYEVRYVLHYDRKADATVFDAEIAGNRTLVVAIPRRLTDGTQPYAPIPPLAVTNACVEIGLKRPFSLLHVSDSHLVRIDSRSGDDLHRFARMRSRNGRELGEHYLNAAFEYARGKGLKVVHAGDVMEFASEANFEYVGRRFSGEDVLACVGNHEYWAGATDVGKPQLRKSPLVRSVFGADAAAVVPYGEVTFFVFDDADGRVSPRVDAAFSRAVALGRPLVLVCHVPFAVDALAERFPYLPGGPAWEPDAVTADFIRRIRTEPLVKAVLCGHLHTALDVPFSPTARQYVAGALFAGQAREIHFR